MMSQTGKDIILISNTKLGHTAATRRSPLSEQAYSAVGKVVVNSQFFEVAFIVFAKLVLVNEDVTELKHLSPLSKTQSFRQATKSALKELQAKVTLESGFESKMDSVIERRHDLIHRWLLNNGWPSDPRDPEWAKVVEFADHLSTDLNAMTRVLIFAIREWMNKFPEMAGSLDGVDSEWLSALPKEFRLMRFKQP
jgi:hypothetical protein